MFADLGVPDAGVALAKADLAHRIGEVVRGRKLSQTAAAELLGVTQPKVSDLMRGKLDGFTVDRLLKLLGRIGQSVEIAVRPADGVRPPGTRTRVGTEVSDSEGSERQGARATSTLAARSTADPSADFSDLLEEITRADVFRALARYEDEGAPKFRIASDPRVKWYIAAAKRKYAHRPIIAFAAERHCGRVLSNDDEDFDGGRDGQCKALLKKLRFVVVDKPQ